MGVFDAYGRGDVYDEMVDAEGGCRLEWREVCEQIEKVGIEGLKARQAEIDWSLEENGVTYNVYNDPEGNYKRRWNLDPIPFVIGEAEWETIRMGVRQRARLFDLMLRDLYGPQRLLKENIVPAEVLFSHKGYISEVFDFGEKEGFNLYFYAADMARGPDGKMWVVNDRIQAPSGLGYAIENRLCMNGIAKSLYPGVKTRKLIGFIDTMKATIEKLTGEELSTAALLTPGPRNETYFEHAYLSSLLGIVMVQGDDLLVKNDMLWLKSLGGLRRINTLLRRVDDRFCDPLELRSDSHLGVPGLVEAMRHNHLKMMNPVGSGVLENVGFNPFMEHVCRFFLDEELILPQIATWWCGQKKELQYVLEHLDMLIIKKIDRSETTRTYVGRQLSLSDRERLRKLILRTPHLFAAQEEIAFSTVPSFDGEKVVPRNAAVRAFAVRKEDDYKVMNGGLVRVSPAKDALLVSSQKGGTSKDLWIVTEKEERVPVNPFKYLPRIDASIDEIPTLRAENLYWHGRYLARVIDTTRLIRYTLKQLINDYREEGGLPGETRRVLLQSVTHVTMTYPGFLESEQGEKLFQQPHKELVPVLKDASRMGSLSFSIARLADTNVAIKSLLAMESWKLFEKMQGEWHHFCHSHLRHNRVLINELDRLHIYLMAYKELVEESVFKEQGLLIYEIGFELENALLFISKARALLSLKHEKAAEYELLEAVLHSSESYNAYRAHYKSSLQLDNVVELMLLNPQFPKSLIYRASRLLKRFEVLPKSTKQLAGYERPVFKAYSLLRLADLDALLDSANEEGVYTGFDAMLSELSSLFVEASNELTKTYFSHYGE